ncbi:MAG: four helix bundle protein [Candidatus Aerophobetes bacterium]|nr:four helix bundle protein [Candidatus Aerophobetes bacterium]
MRTHKDLDVWKESIELVTKMYRLVSSFSKEERFGLVDQMKPTVFSLGLPPFLVNLLNSPKEVEGGKSISPENLIIKGLRENYYIIFNNTSIIRGLKNA